MLSFHVDRKSKVRGEFKQTSTKVEEADSEEDEASASMSKEEEGGGVNKKEESEEEDDDKAICERMYLISYR